MQAHNVRAKIAKAKRGALSTEARDELTLLDMLACAGGESYVEDFLEAMNQSRTETGDRDERRSHRALVRAGLVGFME